MTAGFITLSQRWPTVGKYMEDRHLYLTVSSLRSPRDVVYSATCDNDGLGELYFSWPNERHYKKLILYNSVTSFVRPIYGSIKTSNSGIWKFLAN